MVKYILPAIVALAALSTGAIVSTETGASDTLVIVSAVVGAAVVPLGGYAALAALVALLPRAVVDQISILVGSIIAGGDAYIATAVHVESWIQVTLIVLVTLAGATRIYVRVTPLSNPHDDTGNPLTPAGT
jgi:hypothetical protein